MTALNAFIPLQKVDLAKRQVWGMAAVEEPDRANPPEIMDYARSKPHFLAWSETVQKASSGKSLGNVRAMHGGQMLAVGKVIHLEPRDAVKSVYVGIEVVDDAAWEKVQKGVYTGFSIGGKYGARWPDQLVKGATRYEAIPNELSLVDLPCIPGATFEVFKADGASELHKFVTAEEDKPNPTKGDSPAGDQQPAAEGASQTGDQPTQENNQPPEGDTPPAGDQPAPAAENANPEAETETETPESVPSGTEGAQPAQEPERLDAEAVKGILISLLMDLGLVQPNGAQPMSMAIKIENLSKALGSQTSQVAGRIGELRKTVDGFKSEIDSRQSAIVNDLAQIVLAVQTLEKRGGQGPVIRDLGAISPTAMAEMQKVAVLKDLVKETEDPLTRQKLQEEIARLEIKAIQTQK